MSSAGSHIPQPAPSGGNRKSHRHEAMPYPERAFQFVREGLQHTVQQIHPELTLDDAEDHVAPNAATESTETASNRHVTGKQLCLGLKDYALRQYGLLARTVLTHWNVRRTEDFGRIVFAMVDSGELRTSEGDSPEDFRGVFNFEEAFADLRPVRN